MAEQQCQALRRGDEELSEDLFEEAQKSSEEPIEEPETFIANALVGSACHGKSPGYEVNPARKNLLDAYGDTVRAELEAEKAVTTAKVALKDVVAKGAALVADLMADGLTSTQIAFHAGKAVGRTPDVRVRLRLAARLRKRVSRLVTLGHGEVPGPSGVTPTAPISSPGKEATMAIVHRKTTEEWIEDPELDSLEVLVDDDEDEDADEEEKKPRTSRR